MPLTASHIFRHSSQDRVIRRDGILSLRLGQDGSCRETVGTQMLGTSPTSSHRQRSERAEMKEKTLPGQEKRPALEAENARLRREVARLEQEREILKKLR